MRVFVSHPYKDDPEENIKAANRICQYIVKRGYTPISPLHLFSFYQDDENRTEIMEICKELILICDEVWVFGESEGCITEEEYAEEHNIPVRRFYREES